MEPFTRLSACKPGAPSCCRHRWPGSQQASVTPGSSAALLTVPHSPKSLQPLSFPSLPWLLFLNKTWPFDYTLSWLLGLTLAPLPDFSLSVCPLTCSLSLLFLSCCPPSPLAAWFSLDSSSGCALPHISSKTFLPTLRSTHAFIFTQHLYWKNKTFSAPHTKSLRFSLSLECLDFWMFLSCSSFYIC